MSNSLHSAFPFGSNRPMKLMILLFGMVLILEGLPYVANPEAMQKWLRTLSETEPQTLRRMGIVLMIAGFLICFAVQKSGWFQ